MKLTPSLIKVNLQLSHTKELSYNEYCKPETKASTELIKNAKEMRVACYNHEKVRRTSKC